jgi:hypothetical protein
MVLRTLLHWRGFSAVAPTDLEACYTGCRNWGPAAVFEALATMGGKPTASMALRREGERVWGIIVHDGLHYSGRAARAHAGTLICSARIVRQGGGTPF